MVQAQYFSTLIGALVYCGSGAFSRLISRGGLTTRNVCEH